LFAEGFDISEGSIVPFLADGETPQVDMVKEVAPQEQLSENTI